MVPPRVGPTVCFISFRLGQADGVSVEAAKWARAFRNLGFRTRTVAGDGRADHILRGLAIGADQPPTRRDLDAAVADADLVVVENLCSLPLNPAAADVVASHLQGRAAILHHHDLAWQRTASANTTGFPPTDPRWVHVTVNWLSRRQLAERGIGAVAIPNCFDVDAPPGDRRAGREAMGLREDERVVVQPTRAIPRKNIPDGLRLAAAVGGTYWLVGPAEDGYGPELAQLLQSATGRVIHGLAPGLTMADVYAAADVVVLPSSWEGFGNPTIESAIHRRVFAVGRYPVAREIAAYGFRWFPAEDPAPLIGWLRHPDPGILDRNQAIASRHFSMEKLEARLADLLRQRSWDVAGAGTGREDVAGAGTGREGVV